MADGRAPLNNLKFFCKFSADPATNLSKQVNSDSSREQRFLELLAQNRPKLLKICRVYAWERADQDDLYQEIVCHIWQSLPNLHQEAHANTWLYRVALNTAISFVRKDKARQKRVVSCDDDQLREIADPGAGTDGDKNEDLKRLFKAMSQLNEMEKAVITLFLDDLSYEQIASVLGMGESNVGVVLHRAKKKLSALMKEAACTTTP